MGILDRDYLHGDLLWVIQSKVIRTGTYFGDFRPGLLTRELTMGNSVWSYSRGNLLWGFQTGIIGTGV